MKQVGVWMDKKQAFVVSRANGDYEMATIQSELEFFNPRGGSRSKTRWGPQQVVHDSKYTERENHQLRQYFDQLADALSDAGEIVLFGPAGTNAQFKNRLDAAFPELASRVQDVLTSDSLTENQVRALVRDYFEPK